MTETPREDQRSDEAPIATTVGGLVVPLAGAPGLQTLDLGIEGAIGMVCDIDDPDCNPGAFAGTSGASSPAGDDA